MTTSEPVAPEPLALVDTNVLVYATDATSAFHEASKRLRDQGFQGAIPLAISPQILMEFFAVITDPRRVTNPRSPEEARAEVEKYVRATTIRTIHHSADILDRVLTLLQQYPHVSRQQIFDLFLVATMEANDVHRIYTYNQQHFTRFQGIDVRTP